ncbi:hypothetical protein [Streptomyces subrutilus]|uniref:Tyr recombinase domain-containing protein n=1 Tax=Streptomyces subrutilus TaxID=36818 RepID=A0A1E5NXW9_9ACTN|nr:hypothetical protein [Streptomyces subrutilus]OEJ21063.1 hypothetical protein BGK67_34790 [Streptomyces subrutilus]
MGTTVRLRQEGADRALPPLSPAITQLNRLVELFRAMNAFNPDTVSEARLKQLEWVAGELAIAVPMGLSETAGESLKDLLAPEAVKAYLSLGRGGHLRTMATVDTDLTSVDASERIRIYCLETFARHAKVPFETPSLPGWALRPTVSARFRDVISQHLQLEAGKWPEVDRPDAIVRGLAMWGVMCDTLPRLGELESMRLQDLTLTEESLSLAITRQPQGGLRGKIAEPEIAQLSEETAWLLSQWLERRAGLVRQLQGGAPTHLWLSTPPHPDAGLPIKRRGISKWYWKVANAVQIEQDAAGVPEADLVPTRWETMRRTLLAERQGAEADSR